MNNNMKEQNFNTIDEVVEDIKNGKMVIVIDDADRENEGDIIIASQMVTPEHVNFITREARGILCIAVTEERAKELDLKLMVEENTALHQTPFTISIDYMKGTSTGTSAFDRAKTIQAVVDPKNKAADFARPGHIFPLMADQGGVLKRAGHTEAAVDLAKIAGLIPSGILCEIMDDDGSMARTPSIIEFAKKHDLKIITIADIIEYRRRKENLVRSKTVVNLPSKYGMFKLNLYENVLDTNDNPLAIVKGNINTNEPVLVRVHSECLTGDVFGSLRCDCGDQIEAALNMIEKEGR